MVIIIYLSLASTFVFIGVNDYKINRQWLFSLNMLWHSCAARSHWFWRWRMMVAHISSCWSTVNCLERNTNFNWIFRNFSVYVFDFYLFECITKVFRQKSIQSVVSSWKKIRQTKLFIRQFCQCTTQLSFFYAFCVQIANFKRNKCVVWRFEWKNIFLFHCKYWYSPKLNNLLLTFDPLRLIASFIFKEGVENKIIPVRSLF